MDTGSGRVVVIGATNRANAIDPALRRPGRLEREIVLPVPSTDDRLAILLEKTAKVPLAKDVEFLALAERTRGFVGADLNLLVQEASMRALRRCTTVSYSALEHPLPSVAAEDFQYALRHVMPSLQRGYQRNLDQRLSWDNLGGVDAIRHRLEKAIEWPLRYRQTFDRLSLRPCSGVVLYGPPGMSMLFMLFSYVA